MRLPRFFSPQLVGLDVGTDAVKAVALKQLRQRWVLLAAAEAPVAASLDAGTPDPDALADAVAQVLDTLRVRRPVIAAALPGHAAIVKRLSLPVMTDTELAEAIPWEAEQYVPFDLADVKLDYQVLNASDAERATTDVLLVAAKKDKIGDRVDAVVRAGRQPVVLDLEAFALVNAYQSSLTGSGAPGERTDAVTLLVHVGRSSTIVCVLERGHLVFTRDVALGGQSHTDALVRDLGVDTATAERLKFPTRPLVPGVEPEHVRAILREVTAQLVSEIAKSLAYARAAGPGERVTHCVTSGGACGAEGLSDLLAAEFQTTVEVFDPTRSVERRRPQRDGGDVLGPSFAVAVGLAMRQDGVA